MTGSCVSARLQRTNSGSRAGVAAAALLAACLMVPALSGGAAAQEKPGSSWPFRLWPFGTERAEPAKPAPPAPPSPGAAQPGAPAVEVPLARPPAPAQRRGYLGASTITVDSLPSLDPDSLGILNDDGRGLGADMWAGTDRATLEQLLSRLPGSVGSLTLRDLMRRLLLTTALAPEGPPRPAPGAVGLLALRLQALLAMGEVESARALIDASSKRKRDALSARADVESLLLLARIQEACTAADRYLADHDSTVLSKTMIFCQAIEGQHERAALGLGLMREEQAEADPAFVILVEALAGNEEAKVTSLPSPSPLVMAMMAAAQQDLPADVAAASAPAILRLIAMGDNAPIDVRLVAAERAASLGVIPADAVAELYGGMSFIDEEYERAGRMGASEYGPQGRALLYRAARRQIDPVERGRLLQRLWHLAGRYGDYPLAVRLSVPVVRGIPPAPELTWFAPDAARALFAAGQRQQATVWFDVMRERAGANSVIVTSVWPLARLSVGERLPWNPAALEGWALNQRRVYGPDGETRIALLYALISGLGTGAGRAQNWALLLPQPVLDSVDAVPESWRQSQAAAAAGRRGETVARILTGVGERPLKDIEPATWRVVIGALRAVGLEAEARSLALDAAVAAGL